MRLPILFIWSLRSSSNNSKVTCDSYYPTLYFGWTLKSSRLSRCENGLCLVGHSTSHSSSLGFDAVKGRATIVVTRHNYRRKQPCHQKPTKWFRMMKTWRRQYQHQILLQWDFHIKWDKSQTGLTLNKTCNLILFDTNVLAKTTTRYVKLVILTLLL